MKESNSEIPTAALVFKAHDDDDNYCDTCAQGFYGNARLGRPNDCKPCKCPLDVPSNNFSPTCQIATIDYDKYSLAPEEYTCDACPHGYEVTILFPA